MSKPTDTLMRTRVVAQIADWEGEAIFDRVRVSKRGNGTMVIELADADGNFVELSFPSGDLRKLISWRTLMSL